MPNQETRYRVVPLAKIHDRSAFSCGSQALDRYLQQQARQDAEKRVAALFVLIEPPAAKVLGFYSLSASVVTADALTAEMRKKLPRYPQLPVILIGRLAVNQGHKGKGLGEFLLMNALHRCLSAAEQIAAMAVVVDAKDAAAEAFYRHYDFRPLQVAPVRMFLPMMVVAGLFPQ